DVIAKYNRWQREWQAMGGGSPGSSLSRYAPTWRTMAFLLAIGLAIFLLIAMPDTPDMLLAKGAIILAFAIALVARLVRFFWKPRRAKPKPKYELVVEQCLPVPRRIAT